MARVAALSTTARSLSAALVQHLAADDIEALEQTLDASTDDLDERLWGASPTKPELAHAVVENLRLRFADRHDLAYQSISRSDAAELLGTSEQTITNYLDSGSLVGLKRGRAWVLPAWQFEPEAERGMLPALAAVAAAFPGGVVALSRWVQRPSAELDGRTPRDCLAAGENALVVALAASLTSAGW